jgi:ornithine cyclodeaminase/alanine dehydrogenase-like protein (mu-crystallin family)
MKMEMPETGGEALFMPVHLPDDRRLGLKVVTLFPGNPKKGLPVIHALVLVLNGETGAPLAVMDGEVLTALRTGAASGLATDLLAPESARCAAVVGAGVQGRTQLEGVCAVRPVERALVLDQDPARAEAFAARMEQALGLPVRPVQESAALHEADVICTATPSASPVFEDRDIRPGCHINAVGSYRPDMCEIPADTVARARVVVDSLESCLKEAGDLIQPMKTGRIEQAHMGTELGEIAAGLRTGRTAPEEVTLFKSVGNAVQDLAAAKRILDRLEGMDAGTVVSL